MSTDTLWYLGRGSGVVTLVLFTASVILGIGTRSGRPAPWLPRFAVTALHRYTSLLATVFLVLHVVLLLFDPYAQLDVVDTVFPFLAGFAPVWVGLGTLALDLLLALVVTSLLRHRLGYRTWRAIHWSAYAAWPVALVHALGAGTDAGTAWFLVLAGVCAVAVAGALSWRLSTGFTEQDRGAVATLMEVPR
ncbi:ferric reductase-like transmembrane domain-containing protein [Actinophytocola sp.]|uniref:ferric reductase-like transmembrane domain-containing protein n=1 Tax=Actinophytocola sp. TaxID=1872138 RepID=UPI002D4E09E5|nr:ferric reductase-like transmembrane domain-containing protein [Actinophytocola sp.]HYQ63053.1 ferric reductase-like transmembrane domain-containing protein [Actinophytocola sp.]